MFDKLKQLKQMQEMLKNEKVEEEIEGTKVLINGKMEVLEIRLNSDLLKEDQEEILKKCLNQAFNRIQSNLSSKMGQFKGLN